jgi:hypothetical protein
MCELNHCQEWTKKLAPGCAVGSIQTADKRSRDKGATRIDNRMKLGG